MAQVALDVGAVPEHRGVTADKIDVVGLLVLQFIGIDFDSASVAGKPGDNGLGFFFYMQHGIFLWLMVAELGSICNLAFATVPGARKQYIDRHPGRHQGA
ncbi:hypothetical protein [Polaromonas sp.]|uniref:hypothetical protein n=1 Tax=Polaromonas sp. TaxID=1869339 RepID=UPI003BB76414